MAARTLMIVAITLGLLGGRAEARTKPADAAYALAAHKFKAKQYKEAAPLFLDAYRLDPKPAYLYNAARSEHRAGQLKAASEHYGQVLALKGLDEDIVKRATKYKTAVDALLRANQQAAAATAQAAENAKGRDAALRVAAAQRSNTRLLAWVGVGTGVALVGVGGWLLADWSADQADLDKRLQKGPNGKISGIAFDVYRTEQDRIDTVGIGGAASLGVGVVVAGLGAWMLLTAPDAPVSLAPNIGNRGLVATLRF